MEKRKKKYHLPQLPPDISVIDTHCHLDMIGSATDLNNVVARAEAAGVSPLITVGIDLESSKKAIQLAGQFDSVFATVGIHPHNVRNLSEDTYAELEKLCSAPKVVAYGEVGLDYVKEYAPKPMQLEHYDRQLDLARKINLPVVIHDREAHEDIIRLLKKRGPFAAGGVMHCFSGNWSLARKVLDLGFHLSLPGIVTFSKAADMQVVARKIPADSLLLETDAPFLTPEPLRGKKNFPEYILFTAQKIAELRDIPFVELAKITTDNALRFFDLKTR